MYAGEILIHVVAGIPNVVRCASASANGKTFTQATNATDLQTEARASLNALGVDLSSDGLYPCPISIQEAAQFPPLQLPDDPITLAEARDIIYPDLKSKAGWERMHRAIQAGHIQGYLVGSSKRNHRFVSRAEVIAYADQQRQQNEAHNQ